MKIFFCRNSNDKVSVSDLFILIFWFIYLFQLTRSNIWTSIHWLKRIVATTNNSWFWASPATSSIFKNLLKTMKFWTVGNFFVFINPFLLTSFWRFKQLLFRNYVCSARQRLEAASTSSHVIVQFLRYIIFTSLFQLWKTRRQWRQSTSPLWIPQGGHTLNYFLHCQSWF